jgi:hypothetical protein
MQRSYKAFLPLSVLFQSAQITRPLQAPYSRPCASASFHTLHSVVTVAISIPDGLVATHFLLAASIVQTRPDTPILLTVDRGFSWPASLKLATLRD